MAKERFYIHTIDQAGAICLINIFDKEDTVRIDRGSAVINKMMAVSEAACANDMTASEYKFIYERLLRSKLYSEDAA